MADRSVVAVPPSEGLLVEYKVGAGFAEIPGLIDYAESGGAAPTRDVVPLKGGVGKRVGRARVPTITFNAFQVPQHSSWDAMRQAKLDETVHEFRFETVEQELFARGGAAITAAIADATTGVVTFAGDDEPTIDGHAIGPGAAIVFAANDYYIIRTISDTGVIAVDLFNAADGSALAIKAAAEYRVVIPRVGRPSFRARVIDTDQWSIQSENELQAALMLQPFGQLPKGSTAVTF